MLPNSYLKKAESLRAAIPEMAQELLTHMLCPFPLPSSLDVYITSVFPWAAVPDLDEDEELEVPADCRSSLITHQCHKEW